MVAPAIHEYPLQVATLGAARLTAVDADSGTVLWNDNPNTPMIASATPLQVRRCCRVIPRAASSLSRLRLAPYC
jgi:hypothetical protein